MYRSGDGLKLLSNSALLDRSNRRRDNTQPQQKRIGPSPFHSPQMRGDKFDQLFHVPTTEQPGAAASMHVLYWCWRVVYLLFSNRRTTNSLLFPPSSFENSGHLTEIQGRGGNITGKRSARVKKGRGGRERWQRARFFASKSLFFFFRLTPAAFPPPET